MELNQLRPCLAGFYLLLLSGLGLGFCLYKIKEPGYLLLVLGVAGILLSVPFLPPWEADRMRAYAATMPFLAMLPALGVYCVVSRIKLFSFLIAPHAITGPDGLQLMSILLVVVVVIGPLVTKIVDRPAQYEAITCPTGSEAVYMRLPAGSVVHIVNDDSVRQNWLPEVRISDFNQGIHDFGYSEVAS